MSLLNIVVLGVIQGLAELLPVSSSAHVVVAEKLLGLDPSSPPMTLLLVMLHTGTMFAVIVYFWSAWRRNYFGSAATLRPFFWNVLLATALTGLIGEAIVGLLARTILRGLPHAQVEDLFGHLEFIAPALAAVGILIMIAGLRERHTRGTPHASDVPLSASQAGIIGAVQGLSLPFRGFSRSGATISVGMLIGVAKMRAEIFSFALAVVLTPAVDAREMLRLGQLHVVPAQLGAIVTRALLGAVVAFLAGLLALKWLSRWLERGRWHWFGAYCLVAAAVVAWLHHLGY